MYQEYIEPIYDTRWKYFMRSARCFTTEQERLDQAVLDLHLDRLGWGMLLRVGFAKAIFDRKFYKLDPDHYANAAKEINGDIWAPAPYIYQYFGSSFTEKNSSYATNNEGYLNLTQVCAELKIPLTYDAETGIVAVTPRPVSPILRGQDDLFLARMAEAFEEPMMPEPQYNNSEQSRRVIASAGYPKGKYNWMDKRYTNLYSPALLVTKDTKGRQVIYVSHENAEGHSTQGEILTETVILRSYDQGETWERVGAVDNMRWAMLFEVKGKIYLCGNRVHPSHALMIVRIEDHMIRRQILPGELIKLKTDPNEVLVHNGRVYLPTMPRVISADENADLCDPKVWSISNSIEEFLTRDWFFKETGAASLDMFWQLEGNIVKGKNGKIYEICRLEICPNNGYAALMELSADGLHISPEPTCNALVEMPTTVTKFQARYDEATDLYLAMTNLPTLPNPYPSRKSAPPCGHRNILCLAASPDLINWKVIDILLCDRSVMTPLASGRAHGFQYVMWDYDGEDLIYVVREASGYTKNFHDGQYVTMYRLKNYRELVLERYPKVKFWKNPDRKRL
ncbi:MAG: hypothetical protein IJZ80_09700 [Clostridia bacterium]|nr:hypothetical protein [Clostridia bacterium]